MFSRVPFVCAGFAVLAITTAASPASAAELLSNGGFEANAAVVQSPDPVIAWKADELGLIGGVLVNSGLSSPVSGYATVGAASGFGSTSSIVVGGAFGDTGAGAANVGGAGGAAVGSAVGIEAATGASVVETGAAVAG